VKLARFIAVSIGETMHDGHHHRDADATIRFTVSLPGSLLDELDQRITSRGYASRSELVRDLIRKEMVRDAWQGGDREMVGVLSLRYDHHHRGLTDRLHDIQHRQFVHVICTQHVHIDHHTCVETIVLHGKPAEIEEIAMRIAGLKGVSEAELTRMGGVPGGAHRPALPDPHLTIPAHGA